MSLSLPLILLIAGGVFVVWAIAMYNSFASLKTKIVAAVQEIGNQLKRQANLIPNLEASVKGYMKHEKGIFDKLTDARKSVVAAEAGNAAKIDEAVTKMQSVIPDLKIVVESNPELKADGSVGRLMDELADTADKLSYARRLLIDLTQQYNEKRVLFPSSIIASIFGFGEEKGLATPRDGQHVEVSATETTDPKINL